MSRITPLHPLHLELSGKMVPFGGWELPLHYGSQIEEHHAVRRGAGLFDVSHMTRLDLTGRGALAFLRRLLANDVARLEEDGRALYSCMLTAEGGVIDDLIVYRLGAERYRLVVNAATRERDLEWIEARLAEQETPPNLSVRDDLAMMAVQGPRARTICAAALPRVVGALAGDLARFSAVEGERWLVARTGYTGEDGFEVMLPNEAALPFARALLDAGVRPCGLGARDTLRLEAGMALYGAEMDESTSPFEAALQWTLHFGDPQRDFIGRAAMEAQRATPPPRRQVGLLLEGRGVLRAHQRVVSDAGEGEITSGGFAPTLGRAVALARVPRAATSCEVEIRGTLHPVRLVKPPFVRDGAARI